MFIHCSDWILQWQPMWCTYSCGGHLGLRNHPMKTSKTGCWLFLVKLPIERSSWSLLDPRPAWNICYKETFSCDFTSMSWLGLSTLSLTNCRLITWGANSINQQWNRECLWQPLGSTSDQTLRWYWKEGNYLFNDALHTFIFTVMWHEISGYGPQIRDNICCHNFMVYSVQLAASDLL